MKIVLASKSPRRKELLSLLYSDFEIITADVDETLPESVHPRDGVMILAERKGRAVAKRLSPETLVISSDTLVEMDGVALGKPSDSLDAERMLSALSGRSHNVHTGVCVHYGGKAYIGVDSTRVVFHCLTEKTVKDYVATGEPMDKAGAYGIQGLGGALVKEYHGDFDTVVGLSVALTKKLIDKALSEDKND